MLHTENHILIRAPLGRVYDLAADVVEWPALLAHYRYVRVLDTDPHSLVTRHVRMAACRSGIPVSWTSTQWFYPESNRVRYLHIKGITRGMEVEWRMEDGDEGVAVSIVHDLAQPSGILRWSFARWVAGRFFVRHIADLTLQGIKRHAEASAESTIS